MSRTMSVSDAWAVSAARPITNATAAGPALRVRFIGVFWETGAGGEPDAGSSESLSFIFAFLPGLLRGNSVRAVPTLYYLRTTACKKIAESLGQSIIATSLLRASGMFSIPQLETQTVSRKAHPIGNSS